MTQFIILGLGGRELSDTHAIETAEVLNQINPDDIRILTLGIKSGTDLDRQMTDGGFTLPSEADMIKEQRLMLEHISGVNSHYANHHSVDLLLEIRGQLPVDKSRLLGIMDDFLSLSAGEQRHFILGRRLGYYHRLSDLENPLQYQFVQKQVKKIAASDPEQFEEIFHTLRKKVI